METRTIEGTADQFSEPQTNMASKRIVGQSMSSMQSSLPLGLSAALREEKKTTRPTSVQQLNEISITLQGQQTVQEIVNKATQLFQCLQEASVVVDYKSKQEVRNNNKKVQETLNGLKELFARLRVFYDESNRRLEIPQGEDLEVGLAFVSFKVFFGKLKNGQCKLRTAGFIELKVCTPVSVPVNLNITWVNLNISQ